MTVPGAYQHCEQIVRNRSRSAAYGIMLLPPPKRRALSAVYAFARRIGDAADGDEPAGIRSALLVRARRQLEAVWSVSHGGAGGECLGGDPVLSALADAAARHPIPLSAFDELIDGREADIRGAAPATFDDLLLHCRRVGGSVGRLSLGVFGTARPWEAAPLAESLGVALRLTGILRNLREDCGNGRVRLPAEDLARFGCTLDLDEAGRFTDPARRLRELVRFEAARARACYDTGLRLLPMLDRRSAACTAAVAGVHRRLLERIAGRPETALHARMSLPAWRKAMVATRALTGAAR